MKILMFSGLKVSLLVLSFLLVSFAVLGINDVKAQGGGADSGASAGGGTGGTGGGGADSGSAANGGFATGQAAQSAGDDTAAAGQTASVSFDNTSQSYGFSIGEEGAGGDTYDTSDPDDVPPVIPPVPTYNMDIAIRKPLGRGLFRPTDDIKFRYALKNKSTAAFAPTYAVNDQRAIVYVQLAYNQASCVDADVAASDIDASFRLASHNGGTVSRGNLQSVHRINAGGEKAYTELQRISTTGAHCYRYVVQEFTGFPSPDDTSGWRRIYIYNGPDLDPDAPTIVSGADSTVSKRHEFSCRMYNRGDETVGWHGFVAEIDYDRDNVVDFYVYPTTAVGPLAGGANRLQNTYYTFAMPAGDHRVRCAVNFVPGDTNTSNDISDWTNFTIAPPVVNGSCGTAATNYVYNATGLSGTTCAAGTLSGTAVFPAQGGSDTWVCDGSGGGASPTCTATRAAPPAVNGVCGPAARSYTAQNTAFSGATCTAGTPIGASFPAQGASDTWTCDGANGGANPTCTATRTALPPAPTNPNYICSADGTQVTLTWTRPSGFNNFYFRMRNDSTGGNNVNWNDNITGSSRTVTITPSQQYDWWIHSRAADGSYGPSTGNADFRCDPAPDDVDLVPTRPEEGASSEFIPNNSQYAPGEVVNLRSRVSNNGSDSSNTYRFEYRVVNSSRSTALASTYTDNNTAIGGSSFSTIFNRQLTMPTTPGNYYLQARVLDNNTWTLYSTDIDATANNDVFEIPIVVAAPAVNGVCGTAATNYVYNATGLSGTTCAAGTLSGTAVFPAQGGSDTWVCDGSGGGASPTCTATRDNTPADLDPTVPTGHANITAGQSRTFSSTVTNIGGQSTSALYRNQLYYQSRNTDGTWSYGGPIKVDEDQPALAPGASRTYTGTQAFSTPGIYRVNDGVQVNRSGASYPDGNTGNNYAVGSQFNVAPLAPTGETAICNAAGTQVTLSWTGPTGADGYRLRADNNTSSWGPYTCSTSLTYGSGGDVCLEGITGNSVTINKTPGTTMNWWVHAVDNGVTGSSGGGNLISCAPPTTTFERNHTPNGGTSNGWLTTSATINLADSFLLRWTSTDATSCSLKRDGAEIATGLNNSSYTVTPPPATTNDVYTLECFGNGVSSGVKTITVTSRFVDLDPNEPTAAGTLSPTPGPANYSGVQNRRFYSSIFNRGNRTVGNDEFSIRFDVDWDGDLNSPAVNAYFPGSTGVLASGATPSNSSIAANNNFTVYSLIQSINMAPGTHLVRAVVLNGPADETPANNNISDWVAFTIYPEPFDLTISGPTFNGNDPATQEYPSGVPITLSQTITNDGPGVSTSYENRFRLVNPSGGAFSLSRQTNSAVLADGGTKTNATSWTPTTPGLYTVQSRIEGSGYSTYTDDVDADSGNDITTPVTFRIVDADLDPISVSRSGGNNLGDTVSLETDVDNLTGAVSGNYQFRFRILKDNGSGVFTDYGSAGTVANAAGLAGNGSRTFTTDWVPTESGTYRAIAQVEEPSQTGVTFADEDTSNNGTPAIQFEIRAACANNGDDADPDIPALADENDPGCYSDGDVSNPASYDPTDDDETDPAPTVSLAANPSSVVWGETTTLEWDLLNAYSCTGGSDYALAGWSGSGQSADDGFNQMTGVGPFYFNPTTPTLQCTGESLTRSDDVEIAVVATTCISGCSNPPILCNTHDSSVYPPIPDLLADGKKEVIIEQGDPVSFTWTNIDDQHTCTLTGPGGVSITQGGTSGTVAGACGTHTYSAPGGTITNTGNYTLTCEGYNNLPDPYPKVRVLVLPEVEET